jgi:surface antigen
MRRFGIIIALSVLAVVFLINTAAAGDRRGRRHGIKRHHKYKSQRQHRVQRHRKWHRNHRRPRAIVRHRYWYGPRFANPVWYGYPVWNGPRVIYRPYPRERYVYRSPDYGCAGYYADNDNEVFGSMIGAIGGGVIGHQVGRGSGQALATFAGVLLGSVVGGRIGRDLDDAERLKLASATQYALENQRSGTRTVWDNPDRRVCGVVVPKPAFKNELNQYCREFQQSIAIDGKKQSAYGTACRQPDGQWKIAN